MLKGSIRCCTPICCRCWPPWAMATSWRSSMPTFRRRAWAGGWSARTASATRALEAVLSVLPLDDFVDAPCARMEVVGDPDAVPEICREFQTIVDGVEGRPVELAKLERFAFYTRAREAFAVVQTGETRLYGNLLLKKGVVRPG